MPPSRFAVSVKNEAKYVQIFATQMRRKCVAFIDSLGEAATVFGDVLSTTARDPEHSIDENRYITIGMSINHRLIMVAHTERDDRIRIISARELIRSERETYEEER